MLVFAHDSDIHFEASESRKKKHLHPELLINTSASLVILTGDLTENGYDGKRLNFGLFKFRYGGDEDQLTPFKEQYLEPVEAEGKEVFLCPGNHDRGRGYWDWRPYQPVRRCIKKRHSSCTYGFERQGLRFLVMDEYPRKLKWLKRQLKRYPDDPFVIAFHFNLEGPWSDWWSNKAKLKFYNVIKDYNILALLVGHHHVSQVSEWKGIRVIASANNFALIYYNTEDQIIQNVSFSRFDSPK